MKCHQRFKADRAKNQFKVISAQGAAPLETVKESEYKTDVV